MIRVYGVSVGNGSYARVAQGAASALERLGLLAGFVPVDAFDEWSEYDGAEAPVSIVIAPQTERLVELPTLMGMHDVRWLLLPLNSTWAPRDMLLYAEKAGSQPISRVTGFLSPSKWSASTLMTLTPAPVSRWPHGIESAFRPSAEAAEATQATFAGHGSASQSSVRLLHFTSTMRERKGTVQLARAWAMMHGRGRVPPRARLRIVLPQVTEHAGELESVLRAMGAPARESIEIMPNQNLSPEQMAAFVQEHHIVVQPSRGEGFGMVPLEALACGVPVVATACAGHSEYLRPGTPGTSIVPHGADEPIDDGPGAMAPSVRMADVADAISAALNSWPRLKDAAMKAAPVYQHKWSWDAVMEEWAKREGYLP